MRYSRLMSALSIPLGFVLGHVVAYSLAPSQNPGLEQVAHGYFESLSGSAVPLALFAILIAVLQGRRRETFGLRASMLISQLVAVYVAIEVIEHLAIGASPAEILTEKTLFIGVIVQVLIGFGLHRLLRAGHRLGERLAAADVDFTTYCTVVGSPTSVVVRSSLLRSSIRLRGPPATASRTSF